ncbi:hypothetical protein [Fructilactobacillus florum]|uniref:hypothetical protein n=1 Tax=Fructilactobacillus florum TaxID=640331 RepID=UPI000704ED08|nr:hypothetical protein [Fructilactobacillus florum]
MACDFCKTSPAISNQEYGYGYFIIDRLRNEIQYYDEEDIKSYFSMDYPGEPSTNQIKKYADEFNPSESLTIKFCPLCGENLGEKNEF